MPASRRQYATALRRKARVVLLAREALFLRRGDDAPVLDEAGGRVVVVGGDPENVVSSPGPPGDRNGHQHRHGHRHGNQVDREPAGIRAAAHDEAARHRSQADDDDAERQTARDRHPKQREHRDARHPRPRATTASRIAADPEPSRSSARWRSPGASTSIDDHERRLVPSPIALKPSEVPANRLKPPVKYQVLAANAKRPAAKRRRSTRRLRASERRLHRQPEIEQRPGRDAVRRVSARASASTSGR